MSEEKIGDGAELITVAAEDLLSTGSTPLNLALTRTPRGGFSKGRYYFMVGDSASGKTFQSMTCLAEATLNPHFANYRFIYDNIEDGMLMDLDKLFNEQVADRIEPPARVGGKPAFSATIEEFYYNLDDAILEAGWDSKKKVHTGAGARPFIYILDSMDSLDSEASDDKFQQQKAAHRKKTAPKPERGHGDGDDEKVTGSYGDGKAKKNSENIRKCLKGLRRTGSILIVLSQTRDSYGRGKTRAGGRALRFYATAETWSSITGPIKRTVNGIERKVGNRIKIQVAKNRVTGLLTECQLSIYPTFGVDDVGDCVDYLITEGVWTESGQTVDTGTFAGAGTRDKVIRTIEKKGLFTKLQNLCASAWADVEEKCKLKRVNRYAPNPE